MEQTFIAYLAELPFPILFGLIVLVCGCFASIVSDIFFN